MQFIRRLQALPLGKILPGLAVVKRSDFSILSAITRGFPQEIGVENGNLLETSRGAAGNWMQIAGFKQRVVLKRRCKDCYFMRRDNKLHVLCKTHGRHKQVQIVPKERHTWILSHATQGKVRPW